MRFNVGPIVWRVRLVSDPIDHNGHRCWGICDHRDHTILVWDKANLRVRLFTLIHEITHAWIHCVGPPGVGHEGLCNYIGTIMTQFLLDLFRQKAQFCRFLTGASPREHKIVVRPSVSTRETFN